MLLSLIFQKFYKLLAGDGIDEEVDLPRLLVEQFHGPSAFAGEDCPAAVPQ